MMFGLSLPEQIADRIASQIIEGSIEPGARLKEELLAEEFGTSRAPIREALYILSLQGLVERIPRKGAIVKHYSNKELTQLYQVRSHLEELALRELQLPLTTQGKKIYQNILGKMGDAVSEQDINGYAQLNLQFHRTLFELAENSILANLYNQLEIPLQFILKLSVGNEHTLRESYQEHKEIVALLIEGKRTEAEEALKKHDADSLKRVSKLLLVQSRR